MDRTFSLDKPDHLGNCIFRWNRYHHMHMVGHHVALLTAFLPARSEVVTTSRFHLQTLDLRILDLKNTANKVQPLTFCASAEEPGLSGSEEIRGSGLLDFAGSQLMSDMLVSPELYRQFAEVYRWYRSRNKPLFEVVAINDRDGSVELQHFDGTIEEVDPDDWVSMRAESTGAPEDWSGSVDISVEDLPESSQAIHMDWQTELDALDDDYLSGNDLISTD